MPIVRVMRSVLAVSLILFLTACASGPRPGLPPRAGGEERWGTADLMVVVERTEESIIVLDASRHVLLGRVGGLGNLIHATVKFSHDARYAYVLSRDARVSKVDLLTLKVVKQVKSGEDSVGGVMTQDGKYVALSNYVPGEVRILSADTLETVAVIPAVVTGSDGKRIESRTVGLVDAPGNLLIFGLMDADQIWVVDAGKPGFPVVRKYTENVGRMPYDGLITPDGRYYVSGFLNSNYMGLIDLWRPEKVRKIFTSGAKSRAEVPLWKAPHLKGWAIAGDLAVLPAVKREAALIYRVPSWKLDRMIPLAGTALYTVSSPDHRRVWVDLVGKNGDLIQVIDLPTLKVIKTLNLGAGATHPQFTPKGGAVYVSLMDGHRVVVVDPESFEVIREFEATNPSGIFCADRAHKFGM